MSDIASKLAALRAKKQAETEAKNAEENNKTAGMDSSDNSSLVCSKDSEIPVTDDGVGSSISGGNSSTFVVVSKEVSATIPITFSPAADVTQNIDHIEFLSKMNALQEAIHKQHPTMPVLLMQIHKQLKADPEIVTLLSEEAIGVIVKGLQIQTKTELVSTVVKQSKARDKKTVLTAEMF